jgi:hypothetical protein
MVPVRLVLVGDVGEGLGGVADGPGGVVEGGIGGRSVSGVADAPAFVEDQRGAETGGIDDSYGGWCGVRGRRSLVLGVEEIVEG